MDAARLVDSDQELRIIGRARSAEFEVHSKLGHGCDGLVVAARCSRAGLSSPGKLYAVKMLFNFGLAEDSKTLREFYMNEWKILSQLPSHDNICRFLTEFRDVIPEPFFQLIPPDIQGLAVHDTGPQRGNYRKTQFVVFEFYQQDLKTRRFGFPTPLPLGDAKRFACDLLNAACLLKNHRVVHLDLKLDNIMVANDGHLVLIDFGYARQMTTQEMRYPFTVGMALGGNQIHLAPEVLQKFRELSGRESAGQEYIDYSGQMAWAMGVIISELITGAHPLPDYPDGYFNRGNQIYQLSDLPSLPEFYPSSFQSIVHRLLHPDTSVRATVEEGLRIISHIHDRGAVSTSTQDVGRLSVDVDVLSRRLEQLADSQVVQALSARIEEVAGTVASLQDQNIRLQQVQERSTTDLRAVQLDVQRLQQERRETTASMRNLSVRVEGLGNTVSDVHQQSSISSSEVQRLSSEVQLAANSIQFLGSDVSQIRDERIEISASFRHFDETMQNLQSADGRFTETMENLQGAVASLQYQSGTASLDIQRLSSEIHHQQEQVSAMQSLTTDIQQLRQDLSKLSESVARCDRDSGIYDEIEQLRQKIEKVIRGPQAMETVDGSVRARRLLESIEAWDDDWKFQQLQEAGRVYAVRRCGDGILNFLRSKSGKCFKSALMVTSIRESAGGTSSFREFPDIRNKLQSGTGFDYASTSPTDYLGFCLSFKNNLMVRPQNIQLRYKRFHDEGVSYRVLPSDRSHEVHITGIRNGEFSTIAQPRVSCRRGDFLFAFDHCFAGSHSSHQHLQLNFKRGGMKENRITVMEFELIGDLMLPFDAL